MVSLVSESRVGQGFVSALWLLVGGVATCAAAAAQAQIVPIEVPSRCAEGVLLRNVWIMAHHYGLALISHRVELQTIHLCEGSTYY
jgi:hypothetical protein